MKTKTLVLLLSLCLCPCVCPSSAQAQDAPIIARINALLDKDKFADAQKLLEGQLAKAKTEAERDTLSNALADVHYIWAKKLASRYDFQNAIAHYLLAYESDKVRRRRDAALILSSIGGLYQDMSRQQDAIRYFEMALPIFREVGHREGEAAMLNNIGAGYLKTSRNEEAIRYFEQSLPIQREIKDREGEAIALNNIGLANNNLSRYEEALRYFELALPIRREAEDRAGEATTLNNIGLAYYNLNRKGEAVQRFAESLAIRREIGDEQGEANSLINLGAIYQELGLFQQALETYQAVLPILRAIGYRQAEGVALVNMGLAYSNLNRSDEALKSYQQALPIIREVGDRQQEAVALVNIGGAYDNLGRTTEALTYYQQALPILRETKGRDGEARALSNIMVAYRDQKLFALAIIYGKQAVNVYQSIRRDIANLDETSRAAYLEGNTETYQILARLLIAEGRFAEAEEISAMLQQDEFLDFVRRDARGVQMETLNSDLVGTEQTVIAQQNAQIESVAKLSAEAFALSDMDDPTPAQTARLAQVRQSLGEERKKLDAFFAALPARFARSTTETARDKNELSAIVPLLREMGRATGSKVALVSAFADDSGLELLLTLPTGQTVNLSYAADPTQQDGAAFSAWLNARIFAFKSDILKRAPVENAATALWNVVGCRGALGAQLEGAGVDTIMWRLTGPLRAIPLAALRDKDGYLVEKYRNVVLTAGSSELNLAHQPVGDWRALGVGVTKAWTVEGDQFSALSGVEGELAAVMNAPADGYDKGVLPGRVLRDEKFSEASFFRQLRGADAEANSPWQVVHIASHFKLASDSLKSFLLTGDGKALTIADLQERAQSNPLFPGVELMTLSACDTASGGADNLGALAELNGARSVLATLWPVADQETAQLMADFYANHAGAPGAGKAVALQTAQLKLLRAGGNGAHPYYWAPFVLMGNWR